MNEVEQAMDIVQRFLEASMVPDPETAATYMAEDVVIVFTGRREMNSTQDITDFNKSRYQWVKKDIRQTDVCQRDDHCVVYSTGFLYGGWPDGTAFHGNRYTDRFEVKGGQIVRMDVLNDSAEWILEPGLNRTQADSPKVL